MRKCMDVSLILYAEHDFNASTFAARTTVSTLSDIYSGITTAVGTLRGNKKKILYIYKIILAKYYI